MRTCVYCKRKDTKSGDQVSFFKFPKDKRVLELWIKNMKYKSTWMPLQSNHLCSHHFASQCIDFRDQIYRLRKGSIPTIFDGSEVNTPINYRYLLENRMEDIKVEEEQPNIEFVAVKKEILEDIDDISLEEQDGRQIKNEIQEDIFNDADRVATIEKIKVKNEIKNEIFEENDTMTDKLKVKIVLNKISESDKKFSCEICNKNFKHKSNLTAHKRLHSGKNLFSCKICINKIFIHAKSLIEHERTHTGEKPFSCEICYKKFTQQSSLNQHKRSHGGEKPFSCDVCNKTFNRKNNLIQHKRVHTGEKPFSCDICDKTFSYRCALITHKRIHSEEKLLT